MCVPAGGAASNAGQPMTSIDWLDSLKNEVRLASSYNWDQANTDLSQFQGKHPHWCIHSPHSYLG